MEADVKKTPLNEWHKSHGAQMFSFGGWEMPLNYKTGIVEEHLATRRSGGLFDICHMGRFILKGEGALPFLQYALTNNAAALWEPGHSQYTMLATESGASIDDAYLYRLEEQEYLLVVNASNTPKDWDRLNSLIGRFSGVSLENETSKIAMSSFQGPETKSVLERILKEGSRLPDPGRNNLLRSNIDGIPVIIARTGYTGEALGFEIFHPAADAVALWEKILEAGAKAGVVPVGLGARDTLRLEAGLPLHGHELGLDSEGREIPIMALPQGKMAVSFSPLKGDYIGRNALQKQLRELEACEEGRFDLIPDSPLLPKRIWPVAVLSEGVVRQGFPVYVDEKKIGEVTSGTMVPYWRFEGEGIESSVTAEKGRRALAIVYVNSEFREDQDVKIMSRGKPLSARLVRRNLAGEVPPYARPVLVEKATVPSPGPEALLEKSLRNLVGKARENTVWRQSQTINLIPSEQTPSPLVKLLSISDPCARYAEHRNYDFLGDADIYYYQGTRFIEEVEARLQEEVMRFLHCTAVETRIISGQMANAAVFSALLDYMNRVDRKSTPRRFQKVLNHHIGRGGHLSSQPMGALRDFVAVDPEIDRMAAVNFPVLPENPYQIDLKAAGEYLHRYEPELIILGKSLIIYREPVAELRRMTDGMKRRPWIMYDMAHVLGLAGPHFQQPFKEGADVVTGSTHKTFYGTQRGIIASNWDETTDCYDIWKAVMRRTFPGSVSNHHLGTMVGLLGAAYEMNAFAAEYQPKVVANAKAFARSLKNCGLEVEGDPGLGYTETHQVILRVGYARGPDMARRLEENNIVVNYQALPDDEGFSASSGIRMGVQEMTRFGMGEKDFGELAGLMADVILRARPVREEVAKFRSRFLEMKYCLPKEKAKPLVEELLGAVI